MVTGWKTRYRCCQDINCKEESRSGANPDAKRRDNVGMKRFKCDSFLTITSKNLRGKDDDTRLVSVNLRHAVQHVSYEDVSFTEEAMAIIRDNLEFGTPGRLVQEIQAAHPNITANQIYTAWQRESETLWKRDGDQITSAKALLTEYPDEVDIFEVDSPEGVQQFCWGMKKICQHLRGKIVEIGLDATCKQSINQFRCRLLTLAHQLTLTKES